MVADGATYGIAAVCTASGSDPREVAEACEERGFDILFFPEHSHVPQGPALERPSGPPVGREYVDLFDSVVSTALALAATDRLRAGPGIAVLPQRDPIYFAKEIATLDVLSDGRVLVGVGAGWNPMELENHGVEDRRRLEVLESKLALVRGVLARDPGVLRRLGAVGDGVAAVGDVFGPAPVQVPCPPFLLGGESRATIALALRHGLRWMPSCFDPQRLLARIRSVRSGAYGEEARTLRITAYGLPPDEALLATLRELDVDQFVFRIGAAPGRRVADEIDDVARRLGRAA